MKERRAITKAMAEQYRRSSKKDKGALLDQVVEATGYSRAYAATCLRGYGKRVEVAPGVVAEGQLRAPAAGVKRSRACVYGPAEQKALAKVWKVMDYICGKRLAPQLPHLVPLLARQGTLRAPRQVRDKLTRMSAATVDRLLAPERKKLALKGRSRTKPGTLLKHQIPVRTFADWSDTAPGFMQMDLVAHDGGSSYGEYCQVLDVTDVCSGWSEQVAVPTKAQCFVFAAIQRIRARLPMALLGLDSDNGGEFINHQLERYCAEQRITFTRGRAGTKNDNCYIEQKNWSIVRRFSGYARYEGEQACEELNELYTLVRDYVNFFMPSMKLVEKVRDGARVLKRYDTAQTPYQRLLASPHVTRSVKTRLRRHYATLNPVHLKAAIERAQKRLRKYTVRPREAPSTPVKPAPDHPWRRTNRTTKTG